MASDFVVTFLSALQASLSVLLTIAIGVAAAQYGFLDGTSAQHVSQLSVQIFLPLLLLTSIGSELELGTAGRYYPILIYALLYSITALCLSRAAVILFRLPKWTVAAVTFGNTTSLPLLLTQSLKSTGILKNLLGSNTQEDLDRIKSYFLVFSVVINVLTFGEGERALNGYTESGFPFASLFGLRKYTADTTENGAAKNGRGASGSPDVEDGRRASGSVASEGTVSEGLSEGSTEDGPTQDSPDDITPLLPGGVREAPKSLSRRIVSTAKRAWHASPDPLKRLLRPMRPFLNSTTLGAAAGILIGLTPPLHRLFFSDLDKGGYLQAWLTTALKNIGELFVTLQIIVVGVSLSISFRERKRDGEAGEIPRRALAFVLLMRFVVFPAVVIPIIWSLAKYTNVLSDDPALWFAMMLMPVGPPAMKLSVLADVSDVGEEVSMSIARLLTISYAVTPLLSFSVVGALRASEAVAN